MATVAPSAASLRAMDFPSPRLAPVTSATLPSHGPATVPPLVARDNRPMPEPDLRELSARLAPAGVSRMRPLSGGASSLTYVGLLGERRVAVKVAPPGMEPVRNRDVLRQARIIRALGPSPVPVPEVLWEDAGAPPEIPPLFVMSFVQGSSLEPMFDLDPMDEADQAVVAERLRNAARTLSALHCFTPPAACIAGEPVVGPGEEIERWSTLLQTVDQSLVPGWEDAAGALRSTLPDSDPAAIVHGDFRLGNLLSVGNRITAVVDWEIWSMGDPRVDVGWFLLNADPMTYRRSTRYLGSMPSVTELRTVYEATCGREVADSSWFVALASFKSAATWSLIVKHNRRRPVPDGTVEAMVPTLPRLLSRAAELVG
jgi:aminoglycoside phosphotransferase (APT) family kinase protein